MRAYTVIFTTQFGTSNIEVQAKDLDEAWDRAVEEAEKRFETGADVHLVIYEALEASA